MSRQPNDGPPVGFSINNHIPAPPSEISSGSETTSSPYIPTPLSTTSISDLPLPRITHHQQHQRNYQNQNPSQSQSGLHEPPYIPSTFLPSYYPESRFPHQHTNLHSTLSPYLANRIPDIPELKEDAERYNHTPSVWEKMSRSGPSQFDLLEGIALPSSTPSNSALASSSRITITDMDETDMGGIGGYNTGIALMDLADRPNFKPTEFPSSPINWSTADRLGNGNGNGNGLTAWQPGPSSTSASNLTRSEIQDNSPNSNRQISSSASPHYSSHSQPQANPSPRFHPYSKNPQMNSSSASPANSGSMLPPPNPPQTMSMGRSWSEPTLPENIPHSAGYPGMMYANVPLPEGYISTPPFGGRAVEPVRVGPEEFAQAFEMYNHILSALPFITPSTQPEPSPSANQQSFDSLVSLAVDSQQLLAGSTAPFSAQLFAANDGMQRGKRRNSTDLGPPAGPGQGQGPGGPSGIAPAPMVSADAQGSGNKKSVPKCLGCGATETPEWRRGPMGPRTLCNACGLVHMKLQRKKKKAEEKARAAAAAAAASAG